MTRSQQTLKLIRSAAGPAIALMIVAIFAGSAVFGQNGLLAWGDYKRQLAVRKVELQRLEAERQHAANRVALLNPRGTDPDYADELVRRHTMQVREDEVVILTR